MHEVALVSAIVGAVEKEAAARNARQVKWIKTRFNALTSHSAEYVRFSFDIAKADRPLIKNAKLKLNELEPLLLCKCGHQFHSHHLPDVCPKYGSLEVKAVNSTDMVLESFEVER